jgi:hypothetical protein
VSSVHSRDTNRAQLICFYLLDLEVAFHFCNESLDDRCHGASEMSFTNCDHNPGLESSCLFSFSEAEMYSATNLSLFDSLLGDD